MIVFDLRCSAGHVFEAWFRNGETFERQAAAGEVACALCGDTSIEKAPMAPHVARHGREAEREAGREPAGTDGPAAPDGHAVVPRGGPGGALPMALDPRQVLAVMGELRRRIEAEFDYVGERFPEEARRVHYGETEQRGIYGEATADEARALNDEGIEVVAVPWPSRTSS